ncbi:hypothetical protein DTO164E3_7451 [Paecilomyces variotii]|nr:hypothetical protein DTO164E3_7451 [Paecilomyces variotii]KAJ9201491.1 hypothetical protein DTO032I3_4118 [Paecilomyces variotii]KAJ9270730.1 hypothetical protein DTO212C5_3227 [Paecilomyces variotii]KAJ9275645.1 hypothetical protein DTO021D3_7465 [Paecilomyces variotii]KAJ9314920.1 hypothetical protein DTO271D3_4920 [Paecilomyces variotii]
MPQTYYRRLIPLRLFFAVVFILTVLYIIAFFVWDRSKPYAWIILGIDIFICLVGCLLDPQTAITSVGTLDDGTRVRIRRPLIGFRHLESRVGLTGGTEVFPSVYSHRNISEIKCN